MPGSFANSTNSVFQLNCGRTRNFTLSPVTSTISVTANSVVNQIFQSESFVLQKGLNCPKSTIQCVGTPESLSLYKLHDSRRLVHQTAFPCTNPRFNAVGTPDGLSLYKLHDSRRWYTRKPFPVPTPRFKAVGTPDGLSLYKPTIQGVGTPDGLSLYQIHDSMQLVHQTAFSCTKSTIQCSWYSRKPFPVPNP